MMEGAYFVGRVELLNWLNEFLQLDYKKIENVCSGSAYCQLMDALYPGKVALQKVNFNAKFDYEFTKNFSVLQEVFTKVGIDKRIDVQTLVKGKFQDNLEFCQWMKKYFDMHYGGDPYDAAGRRSMAGKGQVAKPSPLGKKSVKATSPTGVKSPTKQTTTPKGPAGPKITIAPKATKAPIVQGESGSSQKMQELQQQVEELQNIAAEVEKERDFYFGKLREIELLCQSAESNELTESIFGILSASDDVPEEQPAEEQQEREDDETF